MESAKFMFSMTSISQQKRALVEKSNEKSLRMNLTMFQMRPSLCVAILTKLFQQITDHNWLSVSSAQHGFNNFCNLSQLIFEKGDFTPVLAKRKKGIFLFKRAFLGGSPQSVRRLSNQISSLRLETHFFYLCAINIYVTL